MARLATMSCSESLIFGSLHILSDGLSSPKLPFWSIENNLEL
jgi:hypothetical protein